MVAILHRRDQLSVQLAGRGRPGARSARAFHAAMCGSTRNPAATATASPEHAGSARARPAAGRRSCGTPGSTDAELDENGYVMATLARRRRRPRRPAIGLIAHLDTSPDAPGARRRAARPPRLRRRRDRAPARRHAARPGEHARAARRGRTRHRHHAAATRCSAPTTRPASPRSWPRYRAPGGASRAPAPDDARRLHARRGDRRGRDAVRHRPVRRRAAPTRSTAPSSASSRTRPSARSRRSSRSAGSTSIPGQATGKLVNALRLAAQIVAALPDGPLRPRRPRAARASSIRTS